MKKLKPNNKEGLLTKKMDIGSEEFKLFQTILLKKSRSRSKYQLKMIEVLATKFNMEDSESETKK